MNIRWVALKNAVRWSQAQVIVMHRLTPSNPEHRPRWAAQGGVATMRYIITQSWTVQN